jgi:N-glycosylase/DNA lyase
MPQVVRGELLPRGRFSLDRTLQSGQAFTWRRVDGSWLGCVMGELVLLTPGARLRFATTGLDGESLATYLGLRDDMRMVRSVLSRDRWGRVALRVQEGLRLLEQDPWECLLSFALATNTSVGGATRMMDMLRERFGRRLTVDGLSGWTVPTARALARASVKELLGCSLGFRAPHIRRLAEAVHEGLLDLHSLGRLGYQGARRRILELSEEGVLSGVGRKVADCLLLYSYGFQESVPVDRWMARLTLNLYGDELHGELRARLRRALQRSSSPHPGLYEAVASFHRERFAPRAGYAQLYLYSWARATQPPGLRPPREPAGRPGSP